MKAREVKRAKLVKKYAAKKAALKEAGDYDALQLLPKNASYVRLHNRCLITGRPKGYMRQFGHFAYPVPRNGFRRPYPRCEESQLVSLGRGSAALQAALSRFTANWRIAPRLFGASPCSAIAAERPAPPHAPTRVSPPGRGNSPAGLFGEELCDGDEARGRLKTTMRESVKYCLMPPRGRRLRPGKGPAHPGSRSI